MLGICVRFCFYFALGSIALPFKEDEDEEEESSETPTSSTATTSSVEIVELNLLEKDSLISSSDEVLSEPPKDESPGDPEEKEAKSDALEVTEVEVSLWKYRQVSF